eukprot:bmy_20042T0
MGRGADLGPCQHAQAGSSPQMRSHEEPCMPTAGGVGPSAHARTRLLTPCNAPTALQEAGPPWLPSPFQPEYLGDPHPSLWLSFLREGPSELGWEGENRPPRTIRTTQEEEAVLQRDFLCSRQTSERLCLPVSSWPVRSPGAPPGPAFLGTAWGASTPSPFVLWGQPFWGLPLGGWLGLSVPASSAVLPTRAESTPALLWGWRGAQESGPSGAET